ncbi:MAG: hypothetical protein WAX14_02280 [Rhodococcus sp. (in: high G+C Gram-positive bacteria)]|uniref:hypothetical protein n=1 Tax=Rhodococcus sp. TaxID=1831 RepID=UPI003BB5ACE6
MPDPRDVDAITVACRDRQITAWTTVPDPYTRAAVGVRVGDMLSDGWANDAPT